MTERPIFVVGFQRSGTTLLQSLLGAHPRIAAPPEVHFFFRIYGLRDYWGSRNFLLRLSVNGGDLARSPEPASLVLLGTGLLGLIGYRRQRSA